MKTLPTELTFHKRTPDFNNESVPAGILGHHKTADNVWGKIVVTDGSLTYRILEPSVEEHKIDASNFGVVAPQAAHQVEMHGPVTFYIEFYRTSA